MHRDKTYKIKSPETKKNLEIQKIQKMSGDELSKV